MNRFERWRDTVLNEFRDSPDDSTIGTPLGIRGEDFLEFMLGVDGFDPGASAYVYVIVLKRQSDGSYWYYVGETTGGVEGLKSRFETHLKCGMSKPVERNDTEVIEGPLPDEDVDHSYTMIGVDRAEPVSVEHEDLLEARAAERERRMAYEVAIAKETTNVIGGG